MAQVERVRRLAGILYYSTIVVMAVVVIGTIVTLAMSYPTRVTLQQANPGIAVAPGITDGLIMASVVFSLVPMVIWVWTLNQMRLLFGCYKTGAVLTDQSARVIRRIGVGFMGLAVVQLALIPIQGIILTWANPAGERALSIGINSDTLGFFIAAGLMTVIGWAMGEAAQAAAENKGFV
jgi:hypothetical protein